MQLPIIMHEESPSMGKQFDNSYKGKFECAGFNDVLSKAVETSYLEKVSALGTKSYSKNPITDLENCNSSGLLESENYALGPCKGGAAQVDSHLTPQSIVTFCPSPQNSLYSAKQSFTNTEVSECMSSIEKFGDCVEVTTSCDFFESRKTSIFRGSTGSDISDESSSSSLSNAMYKPHKANDIRWEAIQAIQSRDGMLEMKHFRLLKGLGCGDIGSVHLSELTGTRTYFAMKIMDKAALASRKKLLRAQTEREILQSLDHPFLPTLYTHFETEKSSCLVMEFCPGGDLHALRQRQPGKCFPEHAARLGIILSLFFHLFYLDNAFEFMRMINCLKVTVMTKIFMLLLAIRKFCQFS
ncbi:hypothetical protein F2P56_021403 [Juglans regia]|uniref:non-specific serine/threonine protein kinase n=1 Tax=Juglans regia TaxID=51240 RepID=A0A833UR67_JUGRE|nr:hypothetical protein F2P56_021403 [Juglans regia]